MLQTELYVANTSFVYLNKASVNSKYKLYFIKLLSFFKKRSTMPKKKLMTVSVHAVFGGKVLQLFSVTLHGPQ